MNVQQKIVPPSEMTETLKLGRTPARGWLSRRNLIIATLSVVVLGGLYLVFGSGSESSVHYVTESARRGALTETVTATGTVEPTNEVEISSELSGTVKQVLADYNATVHKGEVLAVLDSEKLQAEVDRTRATLAVNRAQVQEAEATLQEAELANARAQALTEKNFASQATRESAEATYQRAVAGVAVAKANVTVAEANLATAETNLSKASIVSPIDGVVLARHVEPGQTVAASLSAPVLFTLAEDLGSMQLEVDIDEADVGTVAAGQSATFTVEAYRDRAFDAKVSMIRYASETINNVVTYTGVLEFDNSDLLMRPGMTATAEIVTKKVGDALLIPNAALRYAPASTGTTSSSGGGLLSMLMPRPPQDASIGKPEESTDGGRTIYVLKNGTPEKVVIHVGASDGSWTEVTDGDLHAEDAVVTDSTTAE